MQYEVVEVLGQKFYNYQKMTSRPTGYCSIYWYSH